MVFGQSEQEDCAIFQVSRPDKGLSKEELHKLRIDLSLPGESNQSKDGGAPVARCSQFDLCHFQNYLITCHRCGGDAKALRLHLPSLL